MVFEFQYENQLYLVELQHVDEKRDKMQILAFKYSDESADDDEYEIKMYRVGVEKLIQVNVMELPDNFKDILAEALRGSMPHTFFANPYFDDVMIFFPHAVFTAQDKYVKLSCSQCSRQNLYEARDKGNKSSYIYNVHTKLQANPNPKWPYKGKLLVQFSVSDKLSKLKKVDLDNLAKAILDSLNGVVYDDDAQIYALVAEKDFVNGLIGNTIAIKELAENERPIFQQHLWTERFKTWRADIKKKEAGGRYTHFVIFSSNDPHVYSDLE